MSPAVANTHTNSNHRKFVKQDSVKATATASAKPQSLSEPTISSRQIISLEEKYGAHK
jgi:hypothetical protein